MGGNANQINSHSEKLNDASIDCAMAIDTNRIFIAWNLLAEQVQQYIAAQPGATE